MLRAVPVLLSLVGFVAWAAPLPAEWSPIAAPVVSDVERASPPRDADPQVASAVVRRARAAHRDVEYGSFHGVTRTLAPTLVVTLPVDLLGLPPDKRHAAIRVDPSGRHAVAAR